MKFVFVSGVHEVFFNRDDVNRYSSEWNALKVESRVGSEDFCEAASDYLFTEHPHLTEIVEQLDDHELMDFIQIVS